MQDLINKYQKALNEFRDTEIKIAQAKTQLDLYQQEIKSILDSEQVSSIQELEQKYNIEKDRFTQTVLLMQNQVTQAREVLSKLGM